MSSFPPAPTSLEEQDNSGFWYRTPFDPVQVA